MKRPTREEGERYIEIRVIEKQGRYISRSEQRFLERMVKKYWDWCGKTEPIIWNRSLPFGASGCKKEEPKDLWEDVE